MEIVLSIAGSDTSAGAGIQQDLKTITALGCYGATVITALTSQNTLGVQDVMSVPPQTVRSQLQAVFADLDVAAIKLGQIPNRGVAEVIVEELKGVLARKQVPVVYDPVMISTSGRRLMEEDCIAYVCKHLFPLCTLVTPNLPETETLTGKSIVTVKDYDEAGRTLVANSSAAFLLKGGHAQSEQMTDRLYVVGGPTFSFASPRIESKNLHGTGCTLSSAVASMLAKGFALDDAVGKAKEVVSRAIEKGRDLKIGSGNGPLWVVE